LREVKRSVRHCEKIADTEKLGDIAMVEFLLLLTVHQAAALEAAAHRYGLTVGQMASQLIQDFLDREGRPLC
jgi:hypothetical protein